jgi:hypothetical protein
MASYFEALFQDLFRATEGNCEHLEIIILRADIGIGELTVRPRSMNRPTTTRYSIIIYNRPK